MLLLPKPLLHEPAAQPLAIQEPDAGRRPELPRAANRLRPGRTGQRRTGKRRPWPRPKPCRREDHRDTYRGTGRWNTGTRAPGDGIREPRHREAESRNPGSGTRASSLACGPVRPRPKTAKVEPRTLNQKSNFGLLRATTRIYYDAPRKSCQIFRAQAPIAVVVEAPAYVVSRGCRHDHSDKKRT